VYGLGVLDIAISAPPTIFVGGALGSGPFQAR
jgi:hypothetical protein